MTWKSILIHYVIVVCVAMISYYSGYHSGYQKGLSDCQKVLMERLDQLYTTKPLESK